ncbi:hypothetical protein B0H14DRAFT_2590149 [Mycena olivaceomarginata]|nr:hypothetical protein B0H14DRAFT_2590149 [Mycena olivaceomarginata]
MSTETSGRALKLTASEDKALKAEALRCADDPAWPVPTELHMWLERHGAPTSTLDQRTNLITPRLAALYACVAARRARIDNLLTLRAEAIKASTHKWPRPRCHPHHPDNLERERNKRREEEALKQVQQEQARVTHLDDLCAKAMKASAHKWPRSRCQPDHPDNLERGTSLRSSPLPLSDDGPGSLEAAPSPKSEAAPALKSPIPFETFLRVFAYCRLRERAVITRLCKPLFPMFRHILYHDVKVRGTAASKLMHSLANNPILPPLVFSLIFADDATSVVVSEWTMVLPTLVNLWYLGITSGIPLPRDIMRSLPFRLTCFQATCAVGGAWKDFVASQPGLSEFYLDGDFCGAVPDSMVLPNLQSLKARPTDVARFVETHALCDVWFFTGAPLGAQTLSAVELTHFKNTEYCLMSLRISAPDFLLLYAAAPEFVELLSHLVLDEDLSWSDFTLGSGVDCVAGSTFGRVATVLNGHFIHLKSILLVFASHSQSPSVRVFRFYARDGIIYWSGWGQPKEEKCFISNCPPYPTPDFRCFRRNGPDPDMMRMFGFTRGTRDEWLFNGDVTGFLTGYSVIVLPCARPPAPPAECRARVRARAKSQLVPTRSSAPQDPEADARWEMFVVSLFRVSDADDDQDDWPTVEANEVENTRLAEVEAARDLAWDAAVAVTLGTMREPDRREWFRDQRMQEEQEAKNAVALDNVVRVLLHECPPYLIFNAGSVFSHCPFRLRGPILDALLPTPAQITPAPAVSRCIKIFFRRVDGEATERAWTQSRRRRVTEVVNSDPVTLIVIVRGFPHWCTFRFFETSGLLGVALGLIHASPVDIDSPEEDYNDMPALEDDVSSNSCSLKSKL